MKELETFLNENSRYPGLYHDGLEVQINVAEDDGERSGRGFQDGEDYWYNFRIISSKNPNYDIGAHASDIGLTGWNYKTKRSEFVGFDFDSVVGHKKGLMDDELNKVKDRAMAIPWVTVRRSTSGNGLHLYVHFAQPVPTKDRKEHNLLAQAILSNLSILAGFDFKKQVDRSGGILWIWSRRATKRKCFELVKQGELLTSIPPDWKERALRDKVKSVAFNIKHLDLSPKQKELIEWFNKQLEPGKPGATWWWDAELNMLVCHTYDLARAHKELNLRGIFETISKGEDCPNDQNCFAFPIKNDAWIVRRHSQDSNEAPSWRKDKSGWTFCFLNRVPTLSDLSRRFGGETSSKGEYVFSGGTIQEVLNNICTEHFVIDGTLCSRQFRVKRLKGARIAVSCDRLSGESDKAGWINEAKRYEKVLDIIVEEREINAPDQVLRYVVTDEKGSGWFLNTKDFWIQHDKGNIVDALAAMGHDAKIVKEILGQCIINPWIIVNEPFGPEYPGNRLWNKYSAQLAYTPEEGYWESWNDMLKHVGKSITPAIKEDKWCRMYGISTGAEYLKLWVACLFQYPMEPLPYLFLHGEQLTGKSSLFEAIDLLMVRGVGNAGLAIESDSGFNREIAGSVLCYVDEVDLSESKKAYSRVKEWTTAKKILIHEKGQTPIALDNSTHWIHCANDPSYCPVAIGDTRVMFIHVPKPAVILTKTAMMKALQEQAPAFLYEVIHNTEIPPALDRLRIPLINTQDKREEQYEKANLVVKFIVEKCTYAKGHFVKYSEFFDKFTTWCPNPTKWNRINVGKAIPKSQDMPVKGRSVSTNDVILGNISFDPLAKNQDFMYVVSDGKLIKENY